jgi:hypothetical protein
MPENLLQKRIIIHLSAVSRKKLDTWMRIALVSSLNLL